jgi:hypothetical protein
VHLLAVNQIVGEETHGVKRADELVQCAIERSRLLVRDEDVDIATVRPPSPAKCAVQSTNLA